MADDDVLRVVVVRRGKVRPTEFRLRDGEVGLSLFRPSATCGADAIVAAVRAAGKQGELVATAIPARVLRGLGLRLLVTPGGTPDPEVNAHHVEARFPVWRRWLLRWRGRSVHEYFNEKVAPRLAEAARLQD